MNFSQLPCEKFLKFTGVHNYVAKKLGIIYRSNPNAQAFDTETKKETSRIQ